MIYSDAAMIIFYKESKKEHQTVAEVWENGM